MATLAPDVDAEDPLERVRKERDYWRAMFESIVADYPEPILVVNAEGVLTHWNDEAVALTGVSATDAVGTSARDVAGVDEGESTIAEQVIEEGEPVHEDDIRSGTSAAGERWHTRDVATPMRDANGDVVGAFEIATDVTELVERREEIEQLQRDISERLVGNVTQLEESAEAVATRTVEISELAAEQSETSDEVSAEIERLSATIEEIASTASEVARHTAEAVELARESAAAADAGLRHMDEIADVTTTVDDRTADLEDAVDEIDRAVDVLDRIADETNMIALNASIEAARVGDRSDANTAGFAVVADEVKSLAEQASERAAEIDTMVERVVDLTEATRTAVEEADDAVVEGSERVRDSLSRLDDIVEKTSEAERGAEQVASATDDQAASTEAVAGMVSDLTTRSERVREAIEDIATENDEHRRETADVRRSIRELSDGDAVDGERRDVGLEVADSER